MVKFYEARHEYFYIIDDLKIKLPSVTKILQDLKIIPIYSILSEAKRRAGELAHSLIENYIKNGIYEKNEYLDRFIEFIRLSNAQILESEKIIYQVFDIFNDWNGKEASNNLIGYAGKRDLVIKLSRDEFVVDIKTGGYSDWHKLQVAAYAYPDTQKRLGLLYLKDRISFKEISKIEQVLLFKKWKEIFKDWWSKFGNEYWRT